MRKNLTIMSGVIVITLVLSTGCRKDTAPVSGQSNSESTVISNFLTGGCRLVHHEWQGAFIWDFHYNDKGLADTWKIDIGDGFPQYYTMKYDRFNRNVVDYDSTDGINTTALNYYVGNRIVRSTWFNNVTPDQIQGDTRYTYNNKGEMIKSDDVINDLYQVMTYDHFGNLTQSNYYQGSYLYFSDNYTFNKPIENPWRTIHGLEYPFPYSGVGLWNTWWFTSNTGFVYDESGNPTVVYDEDPSKTVFKTGFQHHLISAVYYDNISQATNTISFDYDHCGGWSDAGSTESSQNNRNIEIPKTFLNPRALFFHATAKSVKAMVNKLKMQFQK